MLDDDEKGGKVRQREESRTFQVFVFLGLLSLVFLVAIVKLRHSPHRLSVRRRQKRQEPHNLLALHSIYRESVEDKNGQLVSLEHYAGMVSLVVNVASQ